ncbi:MAG: GDP-mannose 4,6-dehydratase, partial [Pusillimonas sp.]|nr:GDP-mannose 4,6-dehydratase [Pusillimonas sp.]
MTKKILITGITGQVGSQLADYVLDNTSYEVIGMMRWQEPMDNIYHLTDRINRKDRITLYYADLNDYSSLARALKSIKPDFISHLAAQSYPKTSFEIPIETLQTNIIGTANLLEAVRQQKEADDYSPTVHVCSSSEVYGRAKPGLPLDEDTPFHGASPYSISPHRVYPAEMSARGVDLQDGPGRDVEPHVRDPHQEDERQGQD